MLKAHCQKHHKDIPPKKVENYCHKIKCVHLALQAVSFKETIFKRNRHKIEVAY